MKSIRISSRTLAAIMTLGLAAAGCNNHGAPQSESSSAPPARLAPHSATAARNLEWAGITLDYIETNLAGVVEAYKPAETGSLASSFLSARAKLAALRTVAAASRPDADELDKVGEFTRNLLSIPEPLLDRIGDLDGKRNSYHDLMADNASLKNTDIPKRFDAALQSLAGNLAQLTACQVEEKRNEAAAAEGEWNLQSLRCDQILDEARDEAAYLDKKEDLKKSMSEAGRLINLGPLDSARDKVRAAKRRQQEAALEKLKLAGQVSQLNLQSELLDDNAGKLDEAVSQANDASDRAVDRIQEAIDQ